MTFSFSDDSIKRAMEKRRRRAGSYVHSISDSSEGNSLTYSASSSQCGESIDSSIADIDSLGLLVEKHDNFPQKQQEEAVAVHSGEKSTSIGSLGCSDDSARGYFVDQGGADQLLESSNGQQPSIQTSLR